MKAGQSVSSRAAIFALIWVSATISGCAKQDDDDSALDLGARRAEATQAAIASAQVAQHLHHADVMPNDGAVPTAPMATAVLSGDAAPVGMSAPEAAPTGMARMLGQPPTIAASSVAGGLPRAIGAPHIYHLAAEAFFLDQASGIGLTGGQQKKLAALKVNAAASYAVMQRKIDRAEQDLYLLSSSETPEIVKIESKVSEIAHLSAQQRMEFIRTVGTAVGALSDAQRKAVASRGAPAPSAAMPTLADPPPITPDPAPPMAAAGMAGPAAMAMPPPAAAMAGMDAGASGGMGHM